MEKVERSASAEAWLQLVDEYTGIAEGLRAEGNVKESVLFYRLADSARDRAGKAGGEVAEDSIPSLATSLEEMSMKAVPAHVLSKMRVSEAGRAGDEEA